MERTVDSLEAERDSAQSSGSTSGALVIVVMGVMGAGKTTVGQRLAARLDWPFLDADDLHPEANRARLRRGEPLGDADRAPWLAAVRGAIESFLQGRRSAVVACSALRAEHRARLMPGDLRGGAVRFVYLEGSPALLAQRLRERVGHFAAGSLLDSQLAALEPPAAGQAVVIDAARPPGEIVPQVLRALGLCQT